MSYAKIPRSYQWPVGLAIALHVLLLVVLCVDVPKTATFRTNAPTAQSKIVNAVALNQTQVDQQIKQIKQSQNRQKATELANLKRFKATSSGCKTEAGDRRKALG